VVTGVTGALTSGGVLGLMVRDFGEPQQDHVVRSPMTDRAVQRGGALNNPNTDHLSEFASRSNAAHP